MVRVDNIPRAASATPNIERRVYETKAVKERKMMGMMVERCPSASP